ncbi:MAG: DNA polymerase III subunit alpha [Bacteroidota bacterium]
MPEFTHLHVHTQYSILDGAAEIGKLLKTAKSYDMKALAITDHGNMYGVFEFVNKAQKEGIKPIVGCEVYVAEKSRFEKDGKDDRSGYHLILLAKNKLGYHNLSKLCSLGHLEGFYYTPRIDKELLSQYCEGIIASSACLGGEIAQTIMNKGIEQAELVLKEYLDIFGDDFYLEMQRLGIEEQTMVNNGLLLLAEKYNVKYIATNDTHYVNAEDAEAHDILVCLNTGKDFDDPNRMRYTGNEYIKTQAEMAELFKDLPEAITNTQEIVDKIENYKLTRDVILPKFPIPEDFNPDIETLTADINKIAEEKGETLDKETFDAKLLIAIEFSYLEYITWIGANKRYSEITPEIKERLDFELSIIKYMGFPGYFLIVQDFIAEARRMGVLVGPGRGSAAGSAVAYCVGITNIDPLKYQLLFERFLNPERISMPDVDIDFDDDGRQSVIEYVTNKYGKECVAQIVTFGTMATKSSIKDVARVLKLPLQEANRLVKLIDDRAKNLKDAIDKSPELKNEKENGSDLIKKTLKFAEILEGSVRGTGVHACGVIIGPEDLKNHVPLARAKDSEMPVIQAEGSISESVGMLKMDFLGLRTLSIIKDAVTNIKNRHNIDIVVDDIPLDDEKTFELFSKGDTGGIFQFESDGMKKHLMDLKPNRFEDLIAMNALYRPGPMQYIPNFINRKHGKEEIVYDIPIMEEHLKETYGITVYQEQVMLLSQVMADFSKGQADTLRKAMGKKQLDMMAKLKVTFVEGCGKKGMGEKTVLKVWDDWEKFAEYAFNKSHSTCYAYIAYQTAYLKAHYPAEFMAAVLSHNINDLSKVTFYMEECKSINTPVLGPDVNESYYRFTVNQKGEIRFGLGAIKGVGENAVESILEERKNNGVFTSIFDFAKRANLRTCNKKSFESLALSGAFDSLGTQHRAQFFAPDSEGTVFLDRIVRHANNVQQSEANSQATLFGDSIEVEITSPQFPEVDKWSSTELLRREKEVIGFYISGHPLDEYKLEIQKFTNTDLLAFKELDKLENMEFSIAGVVSEVNHRMSKQNKPFGNFTLEDYESSYQFMLWSESYLKFKPYLESGLYLYIKGKVVKTPRNDSFIIEPKINSIELLPELRDKLVKTVTITIGVSDISSESFATIQSAIKENPGNTKLKFQIIDHEEKLGLNLNSTKFKVSACNNFINTLKTINNVEVEIN